jgi:hypothetical protein
MSSNVQKLVKPKYKRQQFLLSFIQELDEPCTAVELQKLLFLYLTYNNFEYYDFVPYRFGGYSMQVAADIKSLALLGWIKNTEGIIQYTGSKKQDFSLPHPIKEIGITIKKQLPHKRKDELIKFVYQRYPYYAINSTIAESLLTKEDFAPIRAEKNRLKGKIDQVLFTIGYEGKSIEAYLNSLIQNNIAVLCDVRYNPLSRKLGFSKNKLQKYLKNIGIEYVHIPELGIPPKKRASLSTTKDYHELFIDYQTSLTQREKALNQVYTLLQTKNRIALTCFECEPEMCHRHIVRDYLRINHHIKTQDL